MGQLQAALGVIVLPLVAWLMAGRGRGEPRQALRIGLTGLGLQFAVAGLFLEVPGLTVVFMALGKAVAGLQAATLQGVQFVFGFLAGGPAPYDVTQPQNGFVLALQALPLILVVSVLSRLLYHWGILQRVVGAISWVLERSMGVGGALGTAAAANIFVGMVEAPLLIRPYLATLSRSDLFAMMTAGMATVAGTVMVIYASILAKVLPGAAGHIVIASLISAPCRPDRGAAHAAANARTKPGTTRPAPSSPAAAASWTPSPRGRATASSFSPTWRRCWW